MYEKVEVRNVGKPSERADLSSNFRKRGTNLQRTTFFSAVRSYSAKLPQRVRGRNPAAKRILVHFRQRKEVGKLQLEKVGGVSQSVNQS